MKDSRLLPREGFSIDPLWSAFCFLFLNPLFTAVPAYLLLKSPSKRLSHAVGALFISGCLYQANAFLTKWARNNWTKSDDWDWDNEVVLVTGGSSGVGASLVKKLAKRKIKVVVVGVSNLPYPTGMYAPAPRVVGSVWANLLQRRIFTSIDAI
jgi:all-trans-retinol dehydrogenase (NAD+)